LTAPSLSLLRGFSGERYVTGCTWLSPRYRSRSREKKFHFPYV